MSKVIDKMNEIDSSKGFKGLGTLENTLFVHLTTDNPYDGFVTAAVQRYEYDEVNKVFIMASMTPLFELPCRMGFHYTTRAERAGITFSEQNELKSLAESRALGMFDTPHYAIATEKCDPVLEYAVRNVWLNCGRYFAYVPAEGKTLDLAFRCRLLSK